MTQREDVRGERRSKDPQEIEAEIARTRAAISERIEAISERLAPEHIKEEAKIGAKRMATGVKKAAINKVKEMKDNAVETVSHAAERAGNATVGFARDNAIPLSLIGVGLGWIVVSNTRERRRREKLWEGRRLREREYEELGHEPEMPEPMEYEPRYSLQGEEYEPSIGVEYESGRSAESPESAESAESGKVGRAIGAAKQKIGATKERAEERASEVAHRAKHRISAGVERASSKARDVRGRTKAQLERARGNVVEFSSEQPLVVGAAALMAGFGVGLLLPKTEREDELLGPTRDRLVGEARETAEEVSRAVKETARDVKETLKETQH